eukprot:368846-Hanusia_phi.AAC.5
MTQTLVKGKLPPFLHLLHLVLVILRQLRDYSQASASSASAPPTSSSHPHVQTQESYLEQSTRNKVGWVSPLQGAGMRS